MYLKSLTLKGFKSFAQATTFTFESGVTAIVGPNGSGKSNVVDALAWVMGEQGAKSLRGGKMEDVIFAGTATRGPLGRAEVKLTIDNSDGMLPIEYTEVTISRTLFRNGASEYQINGEGCRLLDVQELLSDSGLGRQMHVIVGQGQLDQVLRASPEDRRGFIEEAAGILKHRRRKERTLRKLDAMETNLTRLNDLAGEVRRQLTPLGRQAETAKRAQAIAAEVRDAKARLLADDVVRLRGELCEIAVEESERHSERIVLQEQLEQKQVRVERIEQGQLGDQLDVARRVSFELESAQSKLRGLYGQAQQRLAFLATQVEPTSVPGRLSVSDVEAAKGEAKRLAGVISLVESSWERACGVTGELVAQLQAMDQHIAQQSELISEHDLRVSQLRGRAEASEQKRLAVAAEVSRCELAVSQAEARAAEASRLLHVFEEETGRGDVLQGGSADAYRAARDHLTESDRVCDEARECLHALEQDAAALLARVAALTRSLDLRDASHEFLGQSRPGVRGRVADHVRVVEGYEAAVGAALGVFADALLVDSVGLAGSIVGVAREDDLGCLGTVIAGGEGGESVVACSEFACEVPHVEGVTRVVDVLLEAPWGVWGLLSRSYIAADVAVAVEVFEQFRSVVGDSFTVVTARGDVLTRHTLSGGSGQAPSRIELTAELEQAREAHRRVCVDRDRARDEFDRLRGVADRAKTDVEEALTQLRSADARRADLAKERNRLVVRAEAGQAEADRAREALAVVVRAEAEARCEAEKTRRECVEVSQLARPILDAGSREGVVEELERARVFEVEARLQYETARERARVADERRVAVEQQFESERLAAEDAARRAVRRARQLVQAQRVVQLLPEIQEACDCSLAEARVVQREVEQQRAGQAQELAVLRAEESELRRKLQVLTEWVHGAELKGYERRLQLSSLLERAGSELGLIEEVLVDEYGPSVPVPVLMRSGSVVSVEGASEGEGVESVLEREAGSVVFVREEQEQRLRRAEKQLAQLGSINPLALEEFAALEQRNCFLTEQLKDLSQTRSDLLAIIAELDEKMQGIFTEAFEDTKRAFAEVFPVLFPGGSGEIALSDPHDLLRTGIEMTVKPAGKKVERLSLLSGGERSLAAVAWLIAIFQARPSPFYIMDEVEAALDDANLGRLLNVFERLRVNSQIIVITHQKRTMEIADALYGVSMRQDGMSAVVGQRVGA